MKEYAAFSALATTILIIASLMTCALAGDLFQHHDDHDRDHDNHVDNHHHFHKHVNGHHHDDHRCATAEPTLRDEVIDQLRFRHAFAHASDRQRRQLQIQCDDLCDQCIEIETYLHLITGNVTGFGPLIPHPTDAVLTLLNDDNAAGIILEDLSTQDDIKALFRANIDVVNQAFQGTPFRFRFVEEATTTTLSNDWSNNATLYQGEMSNALGQGDLQKLDVFVAWSLRQLSSSSPGRVLGVASLPGAQLAGQGDCVIMRYDVLKDGGLAQNDHGYTLVHEIGT